MPRVARRRGVLLLLIGGSAMSLGTTRLIEGAATRERARMQWESVEARIAVAAVRAVVDSVVTSEPPTIGDPVARLRIPAIGLDEIVLEGTGERQLDAGPGHLPSTPLPGAAGNSAISAHRDRHFSRLGELRVGSVIIAATRSRRTRWIVVSTRVLPADRAVIEPHSEPTLTLTTCWPIRWIGPAPERLIVTAKPMTDE